MNFKKNAALNKSFDYSLIRWGVVGVITNTLDYILFVTLFGIINSVLVANLISAVSSYSLNYAFHHRWTFKSDRSRASTGMRYVFNLIFWWIISTIILKILIVSNVDPRVAKLIPFLVIIPSNYFILRRFVFKNL
jgi:putative flippase GtrA